MKTSIITQLVLFLALLTGCKTVKEQTSVHTEVQQHKTQLSEEKSDSAATSGTSLEVVSATDESEETVEKVTVVDLSEPDSVGNQYPTRITTRERSTVKKRSQDVAMESDSTSETNVQKEASEETDLKSDSTSDTESQSKTRAKTPGVVWYVVISVTGAALVFVYLILRRFGLIKSFKR